MHRSFISQPLFAPMHRIASLFRGSIRLVAIGVTTMLALAWSGTAAHAQNYNESLLYSYGNNATDGTQPQTPLINVNGTFYGTTSFGGGSNGNGAGTIYSFNLTKHTETTLYVFSSANIGGTTPYGGLVYDSASGKIFGTTTYGGSSSEGTIYSFDPTSHAVNFLYNFTGTANSNGANPQASMIDINGTLYGTTSEGGMSDYGTVFSFNTVTNAFKTLYIFTGANGDGFSPVANLTYDSTSGKIFGTTAQGSFGIGTIYSLKTDGTGYQTLYTFGGGTNDGTTPNGGLTEVNGIFYGTTYGGGVSNLGTIYSFNPTTNTEIPLYSFQGGTNDGQYPIGDLTYDSTSGRLFGNTEQGGNAYMNVGAGIVFSIKPDRTGYHEIYILQGYPTDVSNPYFNSLLDVSGTLYGTTYSGGANGQGGIYSLTPVPPVAKNDANATKYQTKLTIAAPGILNNDNSESNGPMTATLVTNVAHGTLTLSSNGGYVYTPATGFVGSDSFVYQVSNGFGKGNTATVTLTVQAVAPIGQNDTYTTNYKTALTVAAPGVLGNDDSGGKAPISATLVTNVTHGSLTLNTNGSFSYTPTGAYVGTDSFTYQAVNSIGTGNTATVTLTVQPVVPIAVNNSNTVKADTPLTVAAPGVLGNDDNGGSSPMTASLVTSTTHGTLTLNANGGFTYTPATGFVGTDRFTYQAVNAVGKSNIATATLTVQLSVPTAVNNSNNVKADTPFTVGAPGVLGNDYDGGSPMTASLVTTTTHGTLTLSSNGAFTYTPTHGFVGTDSFTYQAVNATGKSNIATATLIVQLSVPTAVNNSNVVKHNTTFTVPAPGVLGNDYDGGSPMTALLVTTTSHGTLILNSNGAFTYTPNTGFSGTDSFTYQAVNSVGKSNVATATLTVQ